MANASEWQGNPLQPGLHQEADLERAVPEKLWEMTRGLGTFTDAPQGHHGEPSPVSELERIGGGGSSGKSMVCEMGT